MNIVALIPARAGSKRIPGKNTKRLGGEPLINYTVSAAMESEAFRTVAVCSDDLQTLEVALACHQRIATWRRPESADDEPDIAWVRPAVTEYFAGHQAFAILRPTSPFRTAETIRRAMTAFKRAEVHSLRAMQPVTEHPGKMWQVPHTGYPAYPLIPDQWPAQAAGWVGFDHPADRPWHSQPTQLLPRVFVQNASLEIAWSYVVPAFGTISGTKVLPFFTEGYEGFDINTPEDWLEAERIAAAHPELLPKVPTPV